MGPSLIKNVVLVYTDLLMIHSENIVTLIDSFGKKEQIFTKIRKGHCVDDLFVVKYMNDITFFI